MIVRPLPDEQATLTLRHRIHAVHATTGRLITAIAATLTEPLPTGWVFEVRGADVLISAWDDASAIEAMPDVELSVRDPELAVRLAAPDATVALAATEITHEFDPAPSVLEVELITPNGSPSSGRALEARGTTGTLVGLAEDGTTAVYRSPSTTWTAEFHPLEVLVDGTAIQRVAIDLTHRTTRIRLIDPT